MVKLSNTYLRRSNMIKIENLKVTTEDQNEILKSINLTLEDHSINLVMGPNGAGKSTLGKSIMGMPDLNISGNIIYNKRDITTMPMEERARLGIFLAHQSPTEIPGIKLFDFLHAVYNSVHDEKVGLWQFHDMYLEAMKILNLPENFIERGLNENFSGGEKKKSEILQMLILKPNTIILDEIDSGLDIDSVKTILQTINAFYEEYKPILIIISHNPLILDYITPSKVILINEGIVKSEGDITLAQKILEEGYAE